MGINYSPRETLEIMLGHLGFVFEVEEEARPAGLTLHIRTRNPSRLIGRAGKTLDELQFLLNRVLSSHEDAAPRIILDVENYRAHQQEELVAQVKQFVEEVRKTGRPIHLQPMNSFDRRIVHLECQKNPDIETVSPSEPMRLKSITIRLKTSASPSASPSKEASES